MKSLSVLFISSIVFCSSVYADDSDHKGHGDHAKQSSAEYHQAMEKMSQDMKTMEMKGDPDADFAQMMIRHHQSGIEMAQAQIKHGDDPQIKKMSKKMMNEQKKEIDQLQSWLKKNSK